MYSDAIKDRENEIVRLQGTYNRNKEFSHSKFSQNENSFRFSYFDFLPPNSFSEEQESITPNLNGNIFDYIGDKQNISFIKENDDIILNKTENEKDGKIVDIILISSKEEEEEKNRTKEDEKKLLLKHQKKKEEK